MLGGEKLADVYENEKEKPQKKEQPGEKGIGSDSDSSKGKVRIHDRFCDEWPG